MGYDVSFANAAEFAAGSNGEFSDGDALKMNVWVGNHSTLELLAEVSWTGGDAEAIINYGSDDVTDDERDTFLLECVIDGLQRELDRRMRANFDQLPEHVKELLNHSVDAHPGVRVERPAFRSGRCCVASASGGSHDHGTITVEL